MMYNLTTTVMPNGTVLILALDAAGTPYYWNKELGLWTKFADKPKGRNSVAHRPKGKATRSS